MIIHDVEQGSREWLNLRLGIPTASAFDKLVTPKTLKPSASSVGYMHQLLAEHFIGESVSEVDNKWMERGREMEPEARAWYEFDHDCSVRQVGFVTLDDGSAGGSPDGLPCDDGGVEIKCPSAGVHVGYMLGGSHKYAMQIQGCMWICEREWWDFVSYCPSLPTVCIRYYRDEKIIAALKTAVEFLTVVMATERERMEAMGAKQRERPTGHRCKVSVNGDRWCLRPAVSQVGNDWVCAEHAA